MTNEGNFWPIIISVIFIAGIVWFVWWLFPGERRRREASLASAPAPSRAAFDPIPASNPWPAAAPSANPTNAALAWNIIVIIIGVLIALFGLAAGVTASPGDSAPRQTVAALWLIQGLFGLLIAAVGVLGATLVHALKRP